MMLFQYFFSFQNYTNFVNFLLKIIILRQKLRRDDQENFVQFLEDILTFQLP